MFHVLIDSIFFVWCWCFSTERWHRNGYWLCSPLSQLIFIPVWHGLHTGLYSNEKKKYAELFNFSFKYIDILSFFQMHTFVIFWAYLSKWGWNEASSTLFKLFFHNSLIFSNNNSYSFRYRNTTEIPMLRLNIDWYSLSSLYIYS